MTILVKKEISEITRLSGAIADFCAEHHLSDRVRDDLSLALDESVVNVILHGSADSGAHEIIVRLYLEPGFVAAAVEDDGVPFNPLNAPEPELSGPIEQRPIGGLGIHLVRSVMDKLEYHRREGRNFLVMKKRI